MRTPAKPCATRWRSIAAHCDGVRCDMAMLVFNDVFDRTWRRLLRDRWPVPSSEFWPADYPRDPAIDVSRGGLLGSRRGRCIEQGFHFAYDKRLLDALHASAAAAPVRALLGNQPSRTHRSWRGFSKTMTSREARKPSPSACQQVSVSRFAAWLAIFLRRSIRRAPRQDAGTARALAGRTNRCSHSRVVCASARVRHEARASRGQLAHTRSNSRE